MLAILTVTYLAGDRLGKALLQPLVKDHILYEVDKVQITEDTSWDLHQRLDHYVQDVLPYEDDYIHLDGVKHDVRADAYIAKALMQSAIDAWVRDAPQNECAFEMEYLQYTTVYHPEGSMPQVCAILRVTTDDSMDEYRTKYRQEVLDTMMLLRRIQDLYHIQ